jgi:hypothetical protein
MRRTGVSIATLLSCLLALAIPTAAQAEEIVNIKASFTPDALGVPTNVFGSATIGSTNTPLPSPPTKIVVLGPAGLALNLEGTGICNKAKLENIGTSACPANSRAGFGGGIGAFELAKEITHEAFTLDFFLGSNRPGHVVLLIYLNAVTPVSVQLVFTAPIVQEPKPYGLGFSVEVPPIHSVPGATDATALSTFITLGAKNVAYFKKVHGKRKLFHVKGILVPKTCPRGGWPVASQFSFEDGSTVTSKSTIPCPRH